MLEIALTLFLVINPIGNSPAVLAVVKNFTFERQKKILLREAIFAVLIALFFQYFGEIFLGALNIQKYATTITGGLILLLVAIGMIFPKHEEQADSKHLQQEPFIVPIATPLLSGAGLLSTIMLYAARENNAFLVSSAILIAGVGVVGVMYSAPYMLKLFGKRGLLALEQFMGMILVLISVEMLVKGVSLFINVLGTVQ